MKDPWEIKLNKIPKEWIQNPEANILISDKIKDKILKEQITKHNGSFNHFFKNCPGPTNSFKDKEKNLNKKMVAKLHPFGDADKDGIINVLDAKPFNKQNVKMNNKIKKFFK